MKMNAFLKSIQELQMMYGQGSRGVEFDSNSSQEEGRRREDFFSQRGAIF